MYATFGNWCCQQINMTFLKHMSDFGQPNYCKQINLKLQNIYFKVCNIYCFCYKSTWNLENIYTTFGNWGCQQINMIFSKYIYDFRQPNYCQQINMRIWKKISVCIINGFCYKSTWNLENIYHFQQLMLSTNIHDILKTHVWLWVT